MHPISEAQAEQGGNFSYILIQAERRPQPLRKERVAFCRYTFCCQPRLWQASGAAAELTTDISLQSKK